MDAFYILYFVICVLVVVLIKVFIEVDKLKSEIYEDKSQLYTGLVNSFSSVMDILLEAGYYKIPKDYNGTKRKLIYDTITTVLPEAGNYTIFLEDPEKDVIIKDGKIPLNEKTEGTLH